MRPGRLPQDHPLEQQARAKLHGKSPEAQAKEREQATTPRTEPAPRAPRQQPRRWN